MNTSCFFPKFENHNFRRYAALCTNSTDAVNDTTFHTDTTFKRQQSTGQVLRIALTRAMNRNLYDRWATCDIAWCRAEWCWWLSHVLCHFVGLSTAFVSHSTWEVSWQMGRVSVYCVKIICKEVSSMYDGRILRCGYSFWLVLTSVFSFFYKSWRIRDVLWWVYKNCLKSCLWRLSFERRPWLCDGQLAVSSLHAGFHLQERISSFSTVPGTTFTCNSKHTGGEWIIYMIIWYCSNS